MNIHTLPTTDRNVPHIKQRDRLLQYWKSLLSIQPTGNAMVDAGFHEEIRSALRDALHEIQNLTAENSMLRRNEKLGNNANLGRLAKKP